MLQAALAELNPVFRSVLVLRDVEDLSYEEIAEILQLPLGTVKSRILRGREALRKAMERQLEARTSFQLSPQLVE
jgi:RNA polymerase sigma-70 factor (ECF subfamily)